MTHPSPEALLSFADGHVDELVSRHVAGCDACRSHVAGLRAARRLMSERAPRPRVPDAVARSIAQTPVPRRPWRRIAAALALAAAVAVAVAWPRAEPAPDPGLALREAMVEDHVKFLRNASPSQVATDRPEALDAFFRERLAPAFATPELDGTRLLGGRLCHLKKLLVALLFYDLGGERISVYGIPIPDGQSDADVLGSLKDTCGHGELGLTVCAWSTPQTAYVAVSQVDPTTIERLRGVR